MTYKTLPLAGAEKLFKWHQEQDVSRFYSSEASNLFSASESSQVTADDAAHELLSELLEMVANNSALEIGSWKGRFDAEAAAKIHSTLQLTADVAGDPDYWRWLTFSNDGLGLQIVDYRYGDGSPGSAKRSHYALEDLADGTLAKLWLRANSVYLGKVGDYDLLGDLQDIDFWESHVLKIDFGRVPQLTRAFVQFVINNELPRGKNNDPAVDPGFRNLAPELTRRNATLAFEVLSEDECYELIETVWAERDSWLWMGC